jgi:hypothetical protein
MTMLVTNSIVMEMVGASGEGRENDGNVGQMDLGD